MIRLAALALAGLACAGAGLAEDEPRDPFRGLFVSDPIVCDHAARTDLSDALFELNASAIIPYEHLVASELMCRFTQVEPEPAPGGFELYAFATCDQVVGTYDDLFWIAVADPAISPPGAALSVNSKHLDAALGEPRFTPYYRCDNLDPETVRR